MKLLIVDYNTDKVLSTVEGVNFLPVANPSHAITTKEGFFDVDYVEINFVENIIVVHSKEYSLINP